MASRDLKSAPPTESAPSAADPGLPELPEAALVAILQRVPLRDRLTRCALVCRAWAAAAVAAAAVLAVQLSRSKQCRQLADWLAKHGAVVQQLSTRRRWRFNLQRRLPQVQQLLHLPVWQLLQLRSLDLSIHQYQLALPGTITTTSSSSSRGRQGASGTPESAAVLLPQLQELRLARCSLALPLLSRLLGATALTQLQWEDVKVFNDTWTRQLQEDKVLIDLWQRLQQLPQLSELRLYHTDWLRLSHIAPVSTLQHLKSFDVVLTQQTDVPTMAALVPAGLTALTVVAGRTPAAGMLPAEACITRLSNLVSFELVNARLAPSCLSGLTGLQELWVCDPIYADCESGPRELLGALQHLTQLRHLQLEECWLDKVEPQPSAEQEGGYECFSALTASSQLTYLAVVGACVLPVPVGAVDHMFPRGRVLPDLRELTLRCLGYGFRWRCVGPELVARIAAGNSCPALQQLTLTGVTDCKYDFSMLQLPPGLTITHSMY